MCGGGSNNGCYLFSQSTEYSEVVVLKSLRLDWYVTHTLKLPSTDSFVYQELRLVTSTLYISLFQDYLGLDVIIVVVHTT
jgi:hypothetical protein